MHFVLSLPQLARMDSLPLAFGAKVVAKTVDITKIESTQRKVFLDHFPRKYSTHSPARRTVRKRVEPTSTAQENLRLVPRPFPSPLENPTREMIDPMKTMDRAGSQSRTERDQIYPSRTRLS